VRQLQKQSGIDLRKDQMALQRLKEAAEKGKIELSAAQQTTSTCRSSPWTRPGQALEREPDARQVRAAVEHLIERCRGPVLRCLEDAKIKPSRSTSASCRAARARRACRRWSRRSSARKATARQPDEVVSLGAAIQAAC